MTPLATKPAGRRQASGQRRELQQRPVPKAPRRVSGPIAGRVAQRRPMPNAQPRREQTRPRLRSSAGRRTATPLAARAAQFVRALPDHPLLDRAVRGQAWIPILGLMLAGIVAMQVEVLKLGASIGRSVQHSTALESRNEALRASVASLTDQQRIERLAAGMGMVMPTPAGVGFLSARSAGDLHRVIANIRAPNAQGFISLLSSNGTVTAAPSPQATGTSPAAAVTASPAGGTAVPAPPTVTPATQAPTSSGGQAAIAAGTAGTTSTAGTAGTTAAPPAAPAPSPASPVSRLSSPGSGGVSLARGG